MSVTINNSPVHDDSIISYPYGVQNSGYSCGWHTGVDIIPHGATESNPILYPVFDGQVVEVNTNPNNSLGCYVLIYDSLNNIYWRYCHMVVNSIQVSVGQQVTTNTPLGRMGMTGNATGIHLHLESATTSSWQCSTFVNPCNLLNIPNVDNTIIYYSGTPTPPTPAPIFSKKIKFPWFIIVAKKRRRS